MQRERSAALALLGGALIPLLIIGMHPTAHDLAAGAAAAQRQAVVNHVVHGVALAAQPVLFLGLLGLSRYLGCFQLTTAALVVYAFGIAAVLSAATLSGFVAPEVIARTGAAEPGSQDSYHALLTYTGFLNQGFAKVNVVASGAAIILWSTAIWVTRRLSRFAAALGFVAGGTLALGVLSGYLRLNVPGIVVATLLQALWLTLVAVQLLKTPFSVPSASA